MRVLTVCTGNICRSPAAERMLAAVVRSDDSVSVASAGTHAVVNAPISPPMAALMAPLGVDIENFAARQLHESYVREADLVLAMTAEHRSAVIRLVPAAVRYTFTFREFIRLALLVDPAEVDATVGSDARAGERLRALILMAAAKRGTVLIDPSEDDVVDPYRLSDEIYLQSFDQIRIPLEQLYPMLNR